MAYVNTWLFKVYLVVIAEQTLGSSDNCQKLYSSMSGIFKVSILTNRKLSVNVGKRYSAIRRVTLFKDEATISGIGISQNLSCPGIFFKRPARQYLLVALFFYGIN